MINKNEIRTELFGVVGFRQPYDPTYDILEAELLESSSGNVFEQFTGYVTVQNIKETQDYKDITDENFNLWLTDFEKDSISKGIGKCFTGDDLIENALLYDSGPRKSSDELLDNDGDFVGYEITVSKRKDIAVFVNKLIAEFEGTGDVKLLLFNDNFVEPLETQTITIADKSSTEAVVDWMLPYANSVQGGTYYIGYLTDSLSVQAYNRNYDGSNDQHCYNAMHIQAIKVTGWNSETLFDIADIEYVSETFGLNFDISSYEDYTSIAVNNKNLFTDVIGYQFAADSLGLMYTSTRKNGVERLQKGNILLELNGNYTDAELPMIEGVNSKLTKAIDSVKKQLTDQPIIQKQTIR